MDTRPSRPADKPAAAEEAELADFLAEQADRHWPAHGPRAQRAVIEEMIEHQQFPCLGAKAVLRQGNVEHASFEGLDADGVGPALLERLTRFGASIHDESGFHSLVVTFQGPTIHDEAHFERLLWNLLQSIHNEDSAPWADDVEADPASPHFAFSAGGFPFFVIGMHPEASRIARRAPLPTLVFNPHAQFEELRRDGRFDGMRNTIRRRDHRLQGSINPMVADHGERSEALQYSGRAVEPGWEPPLDVHEPAKEVGTP
jgi:hypothetical protein